MSKSTADGAEAPTQMFMITNLLTLQLRQSLELAIIYHPTVYTTFVPVTPHAKPCQNKNVRSAAETEIKFVENEANGRRVYQNGMYTTT
jgi:hypothetical protein